MYRFKLKQQITFEPKELPIDGYFPLRVAANNFDLYTYSYLRYGKDQGQERFFNWLLRYGERDDEGHVINPCYWAGAEHEHEVSCFFEDSQDAIWIDWIVLEFLCAASIGRM